MPQADALNFRQIGGSERCLERLELLALSMSLQRHYNRQELLLTQEA